MRATLFAAGMLLSSTPAWCEGPVYVVPGRVGVPVMINGLDASYAVVEGDWGLAKRIHVQPTVYGGRWIDPNPRVGHYYPGFSKAPGYGRLKIEPSPRRTQAKPAESFHQSWSAQSAPPAKQAVVPMEPPQVILAPRDNAAPLTPMPRSAPRRDFRP